MNTYSNSGIHGATGFEFQKHCALLLYLNEYNKYNSQNFFICLEHHDDFLFCFLNANGDAEIIEAYQAKRSGSKWSLDTTLVECVHKLLETSKSVASDSIPKSGTFNQSITFITNNSCEFIANEKTERIQATREIAKFNELNNFVATSLHRKLHKFNTNTNCSDLMCLQFRFIDFGQTFKSQIDQLVGAFGGVFNDAVNDHRAAVNTLISLFRKVELELNQNSNPQLTDIKKRVTKGDIDAAINVITKEKMAFELWRNEGNELAKQLEIRVNEKSTFRLNLQASFDLFKDPSQVAHRKILEFVQKHRYILGNWSTDIECIEDLYNKFIAAESSPLPPLGLKAAIVAAYIEVRE
jgi:hypothetical protein